MQGTIRLVLGFLMVFGGVGGIEADQSAVALPLVPTLIAFAGMALAGWGAMAMNAAEVE